MTPMMISLATPDSSIASNSPSKKPRTWPSKKTKVKRESDGLANGDKADDKEVQDVNDADDDIVSDTGFVNRFKFAQK